MAAHYDTCNYTSYWEGREYEHESELIAIKSFLDKIPKIEKVCEIGAGYGRLIPTYYFRANKVIVSDPSNKLLAIARDLYPQNEKIRYIQSTLENLPGKIRHRSLDLVIFVRVLHHLEDLNAAIESVCYLVKKNGYLILEFANKSHAKAVISEFLQGNFTFPIDIFSKDVRSKRSVKKNTLPFFNYHPDVVKESLRKCHFKIIEKLSVSNIRVPFLKKILPTDSLVFLEKYLQKPLSYINFGPSVFILAKKE